ncbi:MAG: fixL4, partial [bacterium]|nr:fixL4 [bacterium]
PQAMKRAALQMIARSVADAAALGRRTRAAEEYAERLRLVLGTAPVILCALDRESRVTFVAGDALAQLGLTAEALLGQRALDLFAALEFHHGAQPITLAALFARILLGETLTVRAALAGRSLTARFSALVVDGAIEGAVCAVSDVTEIEEVQARAGVAEAQLRSVVENLPMVLIAFDRDGKVTIAEGSCLREAYDPARLLGRPVIDLYGALQGRQLTVRDASGTVPPSGAIMTSVLAGEAVGGCVTFGARTLEYRTVPLRRGGEIVGGVCIALDVTERDRAAEALRAANDGLRSFIDAAPEPAAVLRDGRLMHYNDALARSLGYDRSELIGVPLAELVVAEDRALTRVATARMEAGEKLLGVERRLRRRDGGEVIFVYSGVRMMFDAAPSLMVIGRDITEQRALERKLMLTDRMASMGTLAAGVAHEINNPLAYVIANLGFVHESIAATAELLPAALRLELTDAIADAHEGAERVRQIVRDLKTFSRHEERPLAPVDVSRVLDSSINMAWNEIRHRARLVKDLGRVPPVMADDSRLGQVFLNLLVNAAQAIPDGSVEDHRIHVSSDVEAGFVRVRVRDTGSGIAQKDLGRIFDPFFTTKPVGVGTGLGLSICHQIVTELGGEICVESELGRGTQFTVMLPIGVKPAIAPVADAACAPAAPRRARVLVIDDEPSVLMATRRLLGRSHDVTTCMSGAEALTTLRGGASFDAIFCDVMMPDMSGCELYRGIVAVRPELGAAFAFVTGGVFATQHERELSETGVPVFDKPFDVRDLHAFVTRCVAG